MLLGALSHPALPPSLDKQALGFPECKVSGMLIVTLSNLSLMSPAIQSPRAESKVPQPEAAELARLNDLSVWLGLCFCPSHAPLV